MTVARRLAAGMTVVLFLGTAASAVDLSRLDRNVDGELVIACLGDSNTSSVWQASLAGGFPPEQGWCEQLERMLEDESVTMMNRGLGGATVTPRRELGVARAKAFFSGYDQLKSVLAEDTVDVVVFAFGTNDALPKLNGDPESIVDHYNRLFRRGRSRGLIGIVAQTPTILPHRVTGELRRSLPLIAETNERIVETFSPRYIVDFGTTFGVEDFMDHLHMNAIGHRKRAEAARAALERLAETEPVPAGVRALDWHAGHWGVPSGETPPDPPD